VPDADHQQDHQEPDEPGERHHDRQRSEQQEGADADCARALAEQGVGQVPGVELPDDRAEQLTRWLVL